MAEQSASRIPALERAPVEPDPAESGVRAGAPARATTATAPRTEPRPERAAEPDIPPCATAAAGAAWSAKAGPMGVVSAAVINHDGIAVLPATLAALRSASNPPVPISVIDDASTDGSPDWVSRQHPDVSVVRLPAPGGRPSRLRNWALRNATSRYVLLLDNDVTLEPGCLDRLVEAMGSREKVLAATPSLISASDPNVVYRRGNAIHYLGIATDATLGVPRRPEDEAGPPVPTIPGGNVLVDRKAALELGLFDEAYDFGWGEDSELYARGAWQGWTSLLAPGAIARHVDRPKGTARAEAQMYNRYRFVATHYSRRALLLLAPALLVFEVMLALMSLAQGILPAYLRAVRRAVASRRAFAARRETLQRSRRLGDAAVLVGDPFVPAGKLARSRAVRAASGVSNRVFGAWWALVRRWL